MQEQEVSLLLDFEKKLSTNCMIDMLRRSSVNALTPGRDSSPVLLLMGISACKLLAESTTLSDY